ncbi:MAG: DUF5684 domain-containing protein [Actinomycetota bacterium]|nr:DUF5684 domain-containing protein [Actinomycetota bacterium]
MVDNNVGTIIPIAIVLYLGILIFMLASMWRVFEKAGRPGWAAIIPIYNTYIMLLVAGKPGWWLLLLLIPFVNIVIEILVVVGVAQKFGKGGGFAVGLLFLPFIFFPILAFGSAEYTG